MSIPEELFSEVGERTRGIKGGMGKAGGHAGSPGGDWLRWWDRRRAKPHRLATFAFLIALTATTALYLSVSYRGWMEDRQADLIRTATLLTATVEPMMMSSRLALQNAVALAERLPAHLAVSEIQTVLETIKATVPFVTVATMVDMDGVVLAASDTRRLGAQPISGEVVRSNMPEGRNLLIRGPMPGPLSGQEILALSMRIDAPDGAPAGLLTVGLEVAPLNEAFRSAAGGGNVDVTLFTLDGYLLLAQPPGFAPLGRAYPQAPLFGAIAAGGPTDLYIGTNPSTGADRWVAYSVSREIGAVTAIGVDRSALVSAWAWSNATVVALAFLVALGAVGIMTASQSAIAAKQRALEQANALERSRLEFLGHVSHELRTPLNAILGFGDMIRSGIAGETSPTVRDYNDNILTAGQHLLRIVNDVLDYTRLEAGILKVERRPLELRSAVDQAWLLVRKPDSGVELEVDIAPTVALSGDTRLIVQVFVNLFANAIRHADGVDRIAVVGRQDSAGTVTVTVNNNGRPIPPERLEGLFSLFANRNPFVRSGSEGAGLGLAICREIMRRHNGRIAVDSNIEAGTTLTLTFPAV